MNQITTRELLLGIVVSVSLFLVGLSITNVIHYESEKKYLLFLQALKITDAEELSYGISTDVGNILVNGKLASNDTKTDSEINGEYSYISKLEERYSQHTRVVSYSCGEHTCYRTETYYSWDNNDVVNQQTSGWKMLSSNIGRICDIPRHTVNLDKDYRGTKKHNSTYAYTSNSIFNSVGDKRYSWIVSDTEYTGTIFINAKNRTITSPTDDCIKFYSKDINGVVKDAEPNYLMVLIGAMSIVAIGIVIYFIVAQKEDIL